MQKWTELRRSFYKRPSRSRICIFSCRKSFSSRERTSQFWQHTTALQPAWLSSSAGSTHRRCDQISLASRLFRTTSSDYGQLLCAKGKEYIFSCGLSSPAHFGVLYDVHSQQHTHVSSSYRSSRLGLSHWDPYSMHRGSCLELYYCNIVEWFGGIQALSERPIGFLQCFDTVGLVIWPVKIVPDMTYNVFGGTLNLAQSIFGVL